MPRNCGYRTAQDRLHATVYLRRCTDLIRADGEWSVLDWPQHRVAEGRNDVIYMNKVQRLAVRRERRWLPECSGLKQRRNQFAPRIVGTINIVNEQSREGHAGLVSCFLGGYLKAPSRASVGVYRLAIRAVCMR